MSGMWMESPMSRKDKEENPDFVVVDRRRFTESGERDTTDSASEQSHTVERAAERTIEQPSSVAEEEPPVDFSSFVVSLATQALVLLGEAVHPEAKDLEINLEAARQIIDIIALLQEKTKGNLTNEEEHLIGEVLTSIRLAYVRKAK